MSRSRRARPERTIDDFVSAAKSQWPILAKGAVALAAIIATFAMTPPFVGAEQWVSYGRFVVAIAIVLVVLGARRYPYRGNEVGWVLACVSLLCVTTGLFLIYQWEFASTTREYAGRRVVVGTAYTSDAEKDLTDRTNRHESATDEDLLFDDGGQVDSIWKRDGVRNNRIIIAATYVALLVAAAVLILGVLELVLGAGLMKVRKSDARR